jgi:hypothetical protein
MRYLWAVLVCVVMCEQYSQDGANCISDGGEVARPFHSGRIFVEDHMVTHHAISSLQATETVGISIGPPSRVWEDYTSSSLQQLIFG